MQLDKLKAEKIREFWKGGDGVLPYSMELDYDVVGVPGAVGPGMMALLPPRVNVSARGEVPVALQVFRIRLPCSGLASAEIPLALRLNVTAPPGTKYNDTVLAFKRNKICFKEGCFDKILNSRMNEIKCE
ncbi:Tyrosine-protein kinase RYK [Apis cerana cerana]|uniref:Tyrosine-protein kinase RYK n=1 Tax=Apis cerana cerana TaxID=94128 RepID=A0A2A3E8I1_APICC|nr:Tyrosine-protein kinase RYK [Apis cerana cerana]